MSVPSHSPRVVVVVVAHDRRDLLAEVLAALEVQTVRPARIVVVDNASSDDSAVVARSAGELVDLVELRRNTGGAGGFAAGMAVALTDHEPDWLWLMDDDTVPTPTALERLLEATTRTGAVVAGSRVEWTDGSPHPMNTPRRKPMAGSAERAAAAASGSIPVRTTSFVSMLVRADVVRRVGLPIADYFIWNDDFEYSSRVLRGQRGIHVPASVVVHKTRQLASTDADPGARFYFEVRNKLWMFRHSRGLAGWEKVLYGGSSALRWVRTVVRSTDRSVLADGWRRGWSDGTRFRPRPNRSALAGLGRASEAVAVVEPR